MEELIPRNDVERAYAQACHWAPMRAWTRGTLDFNRNRVGMAAAKYLAMAKKALQNGDYGTTLRTVQTVQNYAGLLTAEETISMVRILCDILSLVVETGNPKLAEVQKESVMAAVHFIAELRTEKNAVLECITQLRRSGGVDLVLERAALNETRAVHGLVERCEKVCLGLIQDDLPASRLKTATAKLIKEIDKSSQHSSRSHTLGILSEFRLYLDGLANRLQDKRIVSCQKKVDACFDKVCSEMLADGQIDQNKNYGQTLGLDLTMFADIYRRQAASHQTDIAGLERHLTTLLSVSALRNQFLQAAEIAKSVEIFITRSPQQAEEPVEEPRNKLLPAIDFELARFCRRATEIFEAHEKSSKNHSDFVTLLAVLAAKNFSFGQNQLAKALLNRVLDQFEGGDLSLSFVNDVWQNTVANLAKYWKDIEGDFILPLIALTELHVGEKDGLAQLYRASLHQIQSVAGLQAEAVVLRSLVAAREHIQGHSSANLIPLLCHAAQNANTRSNDQQCLEICQRIVTLIHDSIHGTSQSANIASFEALLLCLKFQSAYGDSNVIRTYETLNQCFEQLQKHGKAVGILYPLCDFIKAHYLDNIDACPQLTALIERLGEENIFKWFQLESMVPEKFMQDNAVTVIAQISHRVGWHLPLRLLPILSAHLSDTLAARDFAGAKRFNDLILEIEPSKNAMLGQVFFLAQGNRVGEALAILEFVLTDPIPHFGSADLERLEMILPYCPQPSSLRSRVVAQLVPSNALMDTRAITHRFAKLLLAALQDDHLSTAESLMQTLLEQDRFDIAYDGVLNILADPKLYVPFINAVWLAEQQPKTYPLLTKLRSDVVGYHKLKYPPE